MSLGIPVTLYHYENYHANININSKFKNLLRMFKYLLSDQYLLENKLQHLQSLIAGSNYFEKTVTISQIFSIKQKLKYSNLRYAHKFSLNLYTLRC
jgi:hypothetical protein